MKDVITVKDLAGNSHAVLAAYEIDSFRTLVIREWKAGKEWVVHTFNTSDGGFHHGHYCDSLTRATEVFNAKVTERRAAFRAYWAAVDAMPKAS